jgi:hypothetical protein
MRGRSRGRSGISTHPWEEGFTHETDLAKKFFTPRESPDIHDRGLLCQVVTRAGHSMWPIFRAATFFVGIGRCVGHTIEVSEFSG